MAKHIRRLFSSEFKLEAAQRVLKQSDSVVEAANAMGVGKSTMDKWVRQLELESNGISPKASPMPLEQVEIRELKKKIACLEGALNYFPFAHALQMRIFRRELHALAFVG